MTRLTAAILLTTLCGLAAAQPTVGAPATAPATVPAIAPTTAPTTAPATVPADALAAAAAEPGAARSETGLVYRSLRDGTGASPVPVDIVRVHYRGTLTDGTEFDSSYKRGTPASFPLTRVIKCWTEGVQLMKVGGKAALTCPASIAYGEKGARDVIPPGATLRFEIELLAIVNP